MTECRSARHLKEMHNLFKVTFEPLMDFKQSHVGNITKAAIFKSFLHLIYKNMQLFFVTIIFNIFMRKTTNDFGGYTKI